MTAIFMSFSRNGKRSRKRKTEITGKYNIVVSSSYFFKSSFRLIVLLLISGRAQKPMKVIYPTKSRIDSIPVRKDVASANVLTIIGPPAPPTIAEHKIPANEP
jgi:hypothetical protein